MTAGADALRALREKLQEKGEEATYADLGEALLVDLALGWHDGRPFAQHAAELLSRVDGASAAGRDREVAGRALLTVLARRRTTGVRPEREAVDATLLIDPDFPERDSEAVRAFDRREEEYADLAERTPPYGTDDFATDAAQAFAAARTRTADGAALPPDTIGPAHPYALLGLALPPGLRAHFHGRFGVDAGDACAWKFVLVSKALARHAEAMGRAGDGAPVPRTLLEGLLATDLGDLARTALYE